MNYLTLYLFNLEALQWSEVGVYYSMGSAQFGATIDVPEHPLKDRPGFILALIDDRRTKCRFFEGRKWISPECGRYDKFISIIDSQEEVKA